MAPDRGNRTYYVSDERLRDFRALTATEKLRWQEELAAFIRLTRETNRPGADASLRIAMRLLRNRSFRTLTDTPRRICGLRAP